MFLASFSSLVLMFVGKARAYPICWIFQMLHSRVGSLEEANSYWNNRNKFWSSFANTKLLFAILSNTYEKAYFTWLSIVPHPFLNGTAHFCIFIDYKGRYRKGDAINDATIVNLQQKLLFHWTQMYFWTVQKGSNNKKLY